MTTVVNFKQEKCDVKITRTRDGKVPNPPLQGCYGNPFTVEQYGRERCLELYREYFKYRIRSDGEFREAVLKLKGKTLGCMCKPLACHGDIIKEWLDNNE